MFDKIRSLVHVSIQLTWFPSLDNTGLSLAANSSNCVGVLKCTEVYISEAH